jgi:hypothetical protein
MLGRFSAATGRTSRFKTLGELGLGNFQSNNARIDIRLYEQLLNFAGAIEGRRYIGVALW